MIRRLAVTAALVLRMNPNTVVFGGGLALVAWSVGQCSWPLAGTLCGLVLMVVAAWPFLRNRTD